MAKAKGGLNPNSSMDNLFGDNSVSMQTGVQTAMDVRI